MPGPAPTPTRRAGWGTALAGMLLIAGTYGMARFGVGLFAPRLAAERPQLVGALGWAAAAQFTAYCLAAVAAARLVDRSPRAALVLAGVTATTGCLGVVVASDPAVLVVAVFVGGMGGGFASPALVPVIDAVSPPEARATAHSVANAGTAVGVIGVGVLAFAVPAMAPAWLLMALVCAGAAVAVCCPGRGRTAPRAPRAPVPRTSSPPTPWRSLAVPGAGAVVVGAGSSWIWTFGPSVLAESGSVAPDQVGWLWIAVGLGGSLGTLTGALVDRTGRPAAWCTCAGVLALATAGAALSVASGSSWVACTSMALFGAGYLSATAVLILWAREVWPDDGGAATSVLFVALAIGQALGAAGFGAAAGLAGPVSLAVLAAALCAAGGLAGLGRAAVPELQRRH